MRTSSSPLASAVAASAASGAAVAVALSPLSLAQYAPLARVTLKELAYADHMAHMGLGVIGELGEFCDAVKKHHIYNKVWDKVNASEEGGDAWWYVVNYLPELKLTTNDIEPAFAYGLALGKEWNDSPAKLLFQASTQIAKAALDLSTSDLPDEVYRKAAVQIMARNLGMLYGHFELDLGDSLARNIAKLKVRFGDKFSEAAALNRDLGAERAVLEGGAA